MTTPLTFEREIHFSIGRGRQAIAREEKPKRSNRTPGRVPRVAQLMALAIRFDSLISNNVVADYAELALLGHVSRARITQIMNLRMLAPDIQEAILFLPRVERGHDPICMHKLQPIAGEMEWRKQRRMWRKLAAS